MATTTPQGPPQPPTDVPDTYEGYLAQLHEQRTATARYFKQMIDADVKDMQQDQEAFLATLNPIDMLRGQQHMERLQREFAETRQKERAAKAAQTETGEASS